MLLEIWKWEDSYHVHLNVEPMSFFTLWLRNVFGILDAQGYNRGGKNIVINIGPRLDEWRENGRAQWCSWVKPNLYGLLYGLVN